MQNTSSRKFGMKYLVATVLLGTTGLAMGAPAATQNASASDMARAQMVAQQPTRMEQVINRWEYLNENDDLDFDAYSGFLLAYPDFRAQPACKYAPRMRWTAQPRLRNSWSPISMRTHR